MPLLKDAFEKPHRPATRSKDDKATESPKRMAPNLAPAGTRTAQKTKPKGLFCAARRCCRHRSAAARKGDTVHCLPQPGQGGLQRMVAPRKTRVALRGRVCHGWGSMMRRTCCARGALRWASACAPHGRYRRRPRRRRSPGGRRGRAPARSGARPRSRRGTPGGSGVGGGA
jgi:hypothetical protein